MSPPSSAEVQNEWSYTSTPQYTSIAWCSEHRDNFSFTMLTFNFQEKLQKPKNLFRSGLIFTFANILKETN
jgi:hypothetical protein